MSHPNDNPDIIKTSSGNSLLSKIFHKKDKNSKQPTTSDTASVMSAATTLVPERETGSTGGYRTQRFTSTSEPEHAQVGELMAAAQTMTPEEFKVYLRQHKERTEDEYRKQGGGIAGGDWVSPDTIGMNP